MIRWFLGIEWRLFFVGVLIGVLFHPLLKALTTQNIDDFLYNLIPEGVGITFTVLILDRLDSIRQNRLRVEQLLRHVHSRYNHTALQAIEELRALGNLEDGTLCHLELRGAHWEDANLYKADLRGCDLIRVNMYKADLVLANLEDAKVTNEQLAATDIMHGAIMPDGRRYDGRFNLYGDFSYARRNRVNVEVPQDMAAWYGVPLEQYLEGQRWAAKHLPNYNKRSTFYDTQEMSIIP